MLNIDQEFNNLNNIYRGLRKESLEPMNPWYSCVICKKNKTCSKSGEGKSCPENELMTEEEFSISYNF